MPLSEYSVRRKEVDTDSILLPSFGDYSQSKEKLGQLWGRWIFPLIFSQGRATLNSRIDLQSWRWALMYCVWTMLTALIRFRFILIWWYVLICFLFCCCFNGVVLFELILVTFWWLLVNFGRELIVYSGVHSAQPWTSLCTVCSHLVRAFKLRHFCRPVHLPNQV